MKNLQQLKDEKQTIVEHMEALHNKVDEEKRNLTADEKTEWGKHERQISLLAPQIKEAEEREQRAIQSIIEGGGEGNYLSNQNQRPTEWRDTNTGKAVHVLKRNQRFVDYLPTQERNLSLGKAIRSMVVSNWSDAELEQRALSTASGSAGVTVPTSLMANILDLARAKSVLMKAGTQSVIMDTNAVTIAKVNSDPTMQWKSENSAFTGSTVGFEGINLKSFTLGTTVAISRELAADSPNAVQAIEQALSGALAAEIDRVGLIGAGTTQPKGILNWTGVQSIGTVGTVADYNELVDAWVKVLTANGTPNGYIVTPKLAGQLEQLVAGVDGQYLKAPASIAGLERFISSMLPTNLGVGTNESVAFLGDFTQCLFGVRQGMLLEVTNSGGTAFDNHQVLIKLTWRGDFAITNPTHLVKLTGIL